ncbi:MAG: 4-amino-4-deoxy-L-arabinose transferase [Proteobacteria bacterium]|nr:4-amino-4-deoxy-L-arabinose transferase [Pseudomonadota bacterium]NCA28650.1 4-amino-4-deoxy-L-arabinose transferase [Pseudomonadota bacterium]
MNYITILISVFMNALAQVFLKKGMMIIGKIDSFEVNYLNLAITVFKNSYLLCGFLCYGFSIITWMIALSKVEVSFAYPFLSLGYIFVMFFGYFFFNESLNLWKILGVFFILIGVLFIAKSGLSS